MRANGIAMVSKQILARFARVVCVTYTRGPASHRWISRATRFRRREDYGALPMDEVGHHAEPRAR